MSIQTYEVIENGVLQGTFEMDTTTVTEAWTYEEGFAIRTRSTPNAGISVVKRFTITELRNKKAQCIDSSEQLAAQKALADAEAAYLTSIIDGYPY